MTVGKDGTENEKLLYFAQQHLKEVVHDSLKIQKVSFEAGDPKKVIVEQAMMLGADYVCIGNRGQGQVKSLLGSVSEYVLHNCEKSDIIIVKNK
jgi:nucleotide-binding universal stress UspA family protein